MTDQTLELYIQQIDGYIDKLSVKGLLRLKGDIGRVVEQANRRRIKDNILPDGSPMTPRKQPKEQGRKLRANERLKVGQLFIYMRGQHAGRIRRFKNIKTAASAAKKTRIDTAAYDPQYEWGYEIETRGVSRFDRDYIRVVKGKPTSESIRSRMFTKIHRTKYLKSKITNNGVAIKFISGMTSWIAAAHQEGEGNRPERTLLAFSPEELETIEQLVISHLSVKNKQS